MRQKLSMAWERAPSVQPISRLLFCTALIISLTACSRTISFEEEVEISPGEVIVIKREEKHKRASEAFKPGWRFEKSILKLPIKGAPDWVGEELRPMLLLKNQEGSITLIGRAVFGGCTRYREFLYKDGKWSGTAFEQQYFEKEANLLIAGDEVESSSKRILLLEKKKKNNEPGLPDFSKRIVRSPSC